MSKEDEEKTTLYTDQRTYCYTKMPFGLKKSRATYQRLVDKAFKDQIGRNFEACVDDMVIKSHDGKGMLTDIEETHFGRDLGQVLVDFLIEMPTGPVKQGSPDVQNEPLAIALVVDVYIEIDTLGIDWDNDKDVSTLFTDGSLYDNPKF
ncbi:hypothetical protein Tco_0562382 [Tanacetum coccineum]